MGRPGLAFRSTIGGEKACTRQARARAYSELVTPRAQAPHRPRTTPQDGRVPCGRRRATTQRLPALQLLALLTAAAACGSSNQDKVGSDTNWLHACHADAECDTGHCRCGVCTLPCSRGAECVAQLPGTFCLEASMVTEDTCRVGFPEPVSAGLCSHGCSDDSDCGDHSGGARCLANLCLPAQAQTPSGRVATLAAARKAAGESAIAGASPSAGTGTASPAAGEMTPGGTAASAGTGAASPAAGEMTGGGAAASAGSPQAEDAGPARDAGSDGRLGGATLLVDGGPPFSLPNPQPMCPCTSDIEPEDVPKPGEVERNAYGRPRPPGEPKGSPLEGGAWLPQCEDPTTIEFPWWFVAETECIRYSICPLPCSVDSDCPGADTGDGQPRCGTTGHCFLDCRDGRACPDGMACVSGSDGSACYWPETVLAPQCDAYCQTDPRPRECPNWCASTLVACNP